MRAFLIVGMTLGFLPQTLTAQNVSMTDEELLNRLQGQVEAIEERTRGLSIVTGSEPAVEPETSELQDTATALRNDGLTSLADIKANEGTSVVVPEVNTVTRVDEKLEINIQIQFEFDSAALSASEQPSLDQMCRVMQQATNIQLFQIVGHTDSSGSEAYNKRLSQLRAEEVKRHLTSNCGIAETRLRAVGYGEEFPDNTIDPRAPENRRVELQVLG